MSVREIPIGIRAHTELIKKDEGNKPDKPDKPDKPERIEYGRRVLVLDTETTADVYQNLLIGQALLHQDNKEEGAYLFYGEGLTREQMETVKEYAEINEMKLLPREEFVKQVFLPELLVNGTVCVGFNLFFDLPRLAIGVKTREKGKLKDSFELILTENKFDPTLIIHSIDSKKSMFSFKFPTFGKKQERAKHWRQGRFLDLRQLTFALTNESHSLESACNLFGVPYKKREVEHGKIDYDYLLYNYEDVEATLKLYCNLMKEYKKHPIELEPGFAYSPATIGKAYYKAMGIKPLSEIQPDFPKEVLGHAMASYYGGRSECHYRGKPVKDFHTDVVSMYPSVFTLQNLWSWVIADGFTVIDCTDEIKTFLEGITLEDLFQKETWPKIPALVCIIPQGDLLPVRAEYHDHYQIGLNYLTLPKELLKRLGYEGLWYTLADVIASKILTGKIPYIVKAIRIIPGKAQEGLKEVKLRGSVPVDPAKDNFFKKIIELRKEFKDKVKSKGDENDSLQMFLKILANATSYGIYVQLTREESDKELALEVFGADHFQIEKTKDYERPGNYYNPLIATMITGAARLVLAMIERTVYDLGGNYAFCDTDSMSIIDLVNDRPEEIGKQVIEKFKSLLPYDFGGSLLEAEDYNWELVDWNKNTDKGNIRKEEEIYYPLYCYIISAKRYVLYNLIPDGKGSYRIVIRKKSDHGLGHLLPPEEREGQKNDWWIDEVWKRIISLTHNLPYENPGWFMLPAFARQTITKPSIYRIFNREVKNLPYGKTVKPGNFMLVGYPAGSFFIGSSLIDKFYCQKYHAVGFSHCRNKNECEFASSCLANVHVFPIAPFAKEKDNWQEMNWIDKNTKRPVKVAVMPESIEVTNNMSNEGFTLIKTYWDFIKDYHLHPEFKFDDEQSNPCTKTTKGLLFRTHVIAIDVIHIGKETNTLQDEEEQAVLIDEMNESKRLLEYKKDKQSKLDMEQWEELREILKEKAKPRKVWAEKLGITLPFFKDLLNGRYNPSEEIYFRIIELCSKEEIKIPDGKKPIPKNFSDGTKGYIYPLRELAHSLGVKVDIAKRALKDFIFELNNVDYINTSSDFMQMYIKGRTNYLQAKLEEKKRNEIQNLKGKGWHWNTSKEVEYLTFDFTDIIKVRVKKKSGKIWSNIQVRLKDNLILNVLQQDNELAFKLGLFPKPKEIMEGEPKEFESNGYTTNFYDWQKYNPWISVNSTSEHYKVDIETLKADVASGKFQQSEVKLEKGKMFVNALTAWKLYGKEKKA